MVVGSCEVYILGTCPSLYFLSTSSLLLLCCCNCGGGSSRSLGDTVCCMLLSTVALRHSLALNRSLPVKSIFFFQKAEGVYAIKNVCITVVI